MNMATIMGLVRHVLTFVGGYFASQGLIAQSEIEGTVAAVVTLAGVIWSAWQKRKDKAA